MNLLNVYQRTKEKFEKKTGKPICRWFVDCMKPADGIVKHFILGDVPCCQRCANKMKLKLVKNE